MSKVKYGNCQDTNCDMPEEKCQVTYFRGLWRCDGCIEAIYDEEEFMESNRADMIDASVY